MPSIFLTKEHIDNLELEIDVWYTLHFDGSTIKVYDENGKFIKEVIVSNYFRGELHFYDGIF